MLSHPLHPMVVHFPIALLFVGVFFDLCGLIVGREGLRRMGFNLLVLGFLSALAAISLGEWSEEAAETMGISEDLIRTHELFAFWTVAAFTLLFWLRWFLQGYWDSVRNKVIYVIVSITGLVLLSITGYYGGSLVFDYGAEVKPLKKHPTSSAAPIHQAPLPAPGPVEWVTQGLSAPRSRGTSCFFRERTPLSSARWGPRMGYPIRLTTPASPAKRRTLFS